MLLDMNNKDHYLIASALRGPDEATSDLKWLLVSPLRSLAGVTPESGALLGWSDWSAIAREEFTKEYYITSLLKAGRDPKNGHFLSHMERGWCSMYSILGYDHHYIATMADIIVQLCKLVYMWEDDLSENEAYIRSLISKLCDQLKEAGLI